MAKAPQKQSGKFTQALAKRVDVAKGKKLGRDVHAPRWLRAIGGYLKGSYAELRLVRWPTRRATWGFTLAVIGFSLVLVVYILGLDFGFEQLFKKVIL